MANVTLNAIQLLDQMIAAIRISAAGDGQHWREVIGPVHILPHDGQSLCNWAVIPGGTARERAIIASAIEQVRSQYPQIRSRS